MNTDTTDLRELAQIATESSAYWKERAERAEALLREFADDYAYLHRPSNTFRCWHCRCSVFMAPEVHHDSCLIAHTRAHLNEVQP